MERQALVWDCLQVVGLDHLARLVLDSNLGAIEVSHNEVHACQSFSERDLMFNEQISALSLESLVGLLLDYNDDIAWLLTGVLVSLAMESILAVVGCTLVNRSVNDLLLFYDFLAFAGLTFVCLVNNFTLATTIITRALAL